MNEHMDFEYRSEKLAESAGRALGSVTYKYKKISRYGLLNLPGIRNFLTIVLHPLWIMRLAFGASENTQN